MGHVCNMICNMIICSTRGFSLQHKTFSDLNYAQDFGTTMKESLKEPRVPSGLHSRKVELSRVKCFHALVSTLNYVSPNNANSDKRG